MEYLDKVYQQNMRAIDRYERTFDVGYDNYGDPDEEDEEIMIEIKTK